MDSITEIEGKIAAFNKERDWDQFHSPANLAKSISIEAGELLECFQWDEEGYDLPSVSEELADVMNYCFQMAMVLGLDPKKIILEKMEKTAKKYPVKKCFGKSIKYDKYE
ncbi:MAG: nucleotide pyrophosphohydrolase [Bacilli bacterium]|nr:nucleotide pyrophosphohydrolase [Bacilli bacterium]